MSCIRSGWACASHRDLLQVPIAERISQIPAKAEDDDLVFIAFHEASGIPVALDGTRLPLTQAITLPCQPITDPDCCNTLAYGLI